MISISREVMNREMAAVAVAIIMLDLVNILD
jgi:hypothetical protein